MKFCDKQEFFSEMSAEQAFYNHSFKARMLGYDSKPPLYRMAI